jgi:aerobic-type carbon monoxide dehydrogenase small subunit (CoxS/CutS family)
VDLNVNNEVATTDASPQTPLLYVLRSAGFVSVRYGCGTEQCGACLVLVDGEPRYSCTLPLADAAGKSLTTLEGLEQDGQLSAVQAVLLEHNAAQCGYCLSGIVLAATALFARNPHPHRSEIVAALDPHLCRCGAQPRMLRALMALADT